MNINTSSSPVQSSSPGVGQQRHLWSNLQEVCDLLHIPSVASMVDEEQRFQHVGFKTGQRIHTIGQAFDTLYVVHSGCLKTVWIDEAGDEKVLSFPMKGDLLGVDGIHTRHYASEVVALSDCDLILLPFQRLTALGRDYIELQDVMYGVLSRELVREQAMVGTLGALGAEARVARFLTLLSKRYVSMGRSGELLKLRMTRQEIGSYLSLTPETVSRTLSALNELGLISVKQRTIEIKDLETLKSLRKLPPSRSHTKQSVRTVHND